jgi:hypothetical protein
VKAFVMSLEEEPLNGAGVPARGEKCQVHFLLCNLPVLKTLSGPKVMFRGAKAVQAREIAARRVKR